MKNVAAIILIACLTVPVLALSASAQYRPELIGVWSGALEHGARVVPTDQTPTYVGELKPQEVVTMTIIGQDDRSFHGTLGNTEERDYIVGVIKADGKSLLLADNGGYQSATMLTPTTMEYCMQVAQGDYFIAACGVLEKQQEE
ncbi:MAG: hypothetical protein AAGC96_00460 [Pseudomonadota bacterium]